VSYLIWVYVVALAFFFLGRWYQKGKP